VLRRPLVPWRAVLIVSTLFVALSVVREVVWQVRLDELARGDSDLGGLLGLAGATRCGGSGRRPLGRLVRSRIHRD
jgi:hypothetical protein